jgi:predicted RNA binding protein YcfA (HicA-like mRNA interferase family)
MARQLKYREAERALLAHDRRFRFDRAKGSEIKLSHPNFRDTVTLPHHGDGDSIDVKILSKILRAFDLPKDFFDTRPRRKTRVPAPAMQDEFRIVPQPPLYRNPILDFIWVRNGVVDSFIPSELDLHGWVNVHRIGRCPVCNESVQDNGLPCFTCGTMPDASLFDPSAGSSSSAPPFKGSAAGNSEPPSAAAAPPASRRKKRRRGTSAGGRRPVVSRQCEPGQLDTLCSG